MVHLTERQRIEILILKGCGDRTRTHEEVCEIFNNKYEDRTIARGTVSKIIHKFEESGHVRDLQQSGRPGISEEIKTDIFVSMVEDPHKATRVVAIEDQISQTTVRKYLKKAKWHPYKVQIVQQLNEDDPDRRMEFCERMLNTFNTNPIFFNQIIFSDEATFHLHGTVNKQNCRYWSDANPHWMVEAHTQYPQKINVWAAIINNIIIGPYFWDTTLTDEVNPHLMNGSIWFQQDGAPPHYYRHVREFLNTTFPNRWIGRGTIEWPARSPNLLPLDYFLWGYLKNKVYVNRPQTIQELKDRIREEIARISPETIRKVLDEFSFRMDFCLANHIEHHF